MKKVKISKVKQVVVKAPTRLKNTSSSWKKCPGCCLIT